MCTCAVYQYDIRKKNALFNQASEFIGGINSTCKSLFVSVFELQLFPYVSVSVSLFSFTLPVKLSMLLFSLSLSF